MKDRFIQQKIMDYRDEMPVSFHVPGHKNGRAYEGQSSLIDMDVTEIPGTDNLHHPQGVILRAQERASRIYRSKKSYFLVNGTTGGIHAMIMATTSPGDDIVIARNVHKSVHTACVLQNLMPHYVYPSVHKHFGIVLGVSPCELEAVLIRANEKAKKRTGCLETTVKAVVVTSPTYEGIHSDIRALADIAHKYGALLLVDEAHGAHVPLHKIFGQSALSQGADVAVQSTHKSLGALTQASMLHVGTDRINLNRLESWLSMLQSSSPSYVLMASLERALDVFDNQERTMSYIDDLDWLENVVKNTFGMDMLSEKDIEGTGFYKDPSKIIIFMNRAEVVESWLRKKYAIQIEYATADYIVCVTSVWNTNEDFSRLIDALQHLDIERKAVTEVVGLTDFPEAKQVISPQEAFYAQKKTCSIQQAIGLVCAEYIIPYPPGIPILSPGEMIYKDIVDLIYKWQASGRQIIGSADSTLMTVQVIDR